MSHPTLPFGITVCGIDELAGHCSTGASHVLSILDPEFPVPDAFGTYGEHERLELRFDDIIEETEGKRAPNAEDVARILRFGAGLACGSAVPPHLLVHCHVGISRSTAAMALILAQALPEEPARSVLDLVHGIREKTWPNLRMIEIGDAMLQRGGTLVAAAHALYKLQLERRPRVAELMVSLGRAREVEAARRVP